MSKKKSIVGYISNELDVHIAGFRGELHDVRGHPHLPNASRVYTSEIMSYDEKTGEIETRNTIYKPIIDNIKTGEVA